MSTIDLRGRSALVTGGGTRVGAAISRALAAAGCDVAIHWATNEAGARAVEQDILGLGQRAETFQADLHDRRAIERLGAEVERFAGGRLGVLVHNASNFDRIEPQDLDAAAWDRALALNVTAPYLLTLALAPALRKGKGAVVAIACISAFRPWRNYIPYSVSKAALVHLVRGLSVGLAPDVRVNAVAPGTVMPPDSYDGAQLEGIRKNIPLGRIGSADDVAGAVIFLARNDYVTGQVIVVDGGRSGI